MFQLFLSHFLVLGYYAPLWDPIQNFVNAAVSSFQSALNANCPCL